MEVTPVPSFEPADRDLDAYRRERQRREDEEKKWFKTFITSFIPSKETANLVATQVLCLVFFSIFLFAMLGKMAEPGTEIFAIYLISVSAAVGGEVSRVCRLPGLLGMMVVGFLFRNIKSITYYQDISEKTISCSREIALTIILLRAGLELDGPILLKLKMTVLKLTMIPCLVEASSVGIIGHFLLDLPWIFSIMLGFIVSAISPEVSIPILLYLEHQGFGVDKGIPTLIMASASLDDIIAIAGFTMCFSIATSTSHLAWTIIKGPLEPIVGFTLGALFGFIFWYLPNKDGNLGYVVYYNVFLMTSSALAIMFACHLIHLPGAGACGCITISFVASFAWRQNSKQYAGIHSVAGNMWNIFQPFVFASLGAEVTIEKLYNSAGSGILTLFLGLVLRLIVTVVVCSGAGFNWKEKLFICCAWLPKATAQAAIGSQILNYARENTTDPKLLVYGSTVLNICIMSIFITAPLGAVLTTLLGPFLLHQEETLLDWNSLFINEAAIPFSSRHRLSAPIILRSRSTTVAGPRTE